MTRKKIQVLIAGEQFLYRIALENSLSCVQDIEIVGVTSFSNGTEWTIDESPPDVAIVDIDAPDDKGFALVRKIKQHLPSIGIVALKSNPHDIELLVALKSQVAACLDKSVAISQLVTVIKRVARGEYPINDTFSKRPDLVDQVLQEFREFSSQSGGEDFFLPLTARELEVLDSMVQGNTNRRIADELGISEQTIKHYVTSILRKLNANARTEAVVTAIKRGIVTLD